jgi:hypothetical protein
MLTKRVKYFMLLELRVDHDVCLQSLQIPSALLIIPSEVRSSLNPKICSRFNTELLFWQKPDTTERGSKLHDYVLRSYEVKFLVHNVLMLK